MDKAAEGDDLMFLREIVAAAGLDASTVDPPRRKVVDSGGRRVNYLEWGDPHKPVICFLHGGGLTAHTWDIVCAALSSEFHCVAIDLRGHGDSEWAVDGDYSLEAHASDLDALVKTVGLRPFALVGMSLGGLVAIIYASTHTDMIRGLVLVDVGPEPRARGSHRIREFMMATATPRTLEELVERSVIFNPRRRRDVLRRSLLANLRQAGDDKWVWKYDPRIHGVTSAPGKLWSALSHIACPTLVVRGGESEGFLDEDAINVVAALADARWVKIPGAGHSVQGDQPALLVRELRAFMHERDSKE